MFGDPLYAAFLSFTFVFVATPGATTAVVVRNTLDGGRRAGLFAALGAACANATHATVAQRRSCTMTSATTMCAVTIHGASSCATTRPPSQPS